MTISHSLDLTNYHRERDTAATHIAMISEHASPLATISGVDAGGQNTHVAHTARHLAKLGYRVDIFRRRKREERPGIVDWLPGIRVIHVRAGLARSVRKESLLPCMAEFARVVVEHAKAAQERGRAYVVCHAHFFMSGFVARRLKQALAILHGHRPHDRRRRAHGRRLRRDHSHETAWLVAAVEACVALLGLSYAPLAEFRAHQVRVTAMIAGVMRARFLLVRFPDLDPAKLQDLRDGARAVLAATQPRELVVAEASCP